MSIDEERLITKSNNFRIYNHEDFEDFTSPESNGKDQRVLIAIDKKTSEKVVIKTPRSAVLKLKSEYWQRPKYESSLKYLENTDVIDWQATLSNPNFKEIYNKDLEYKMEMSNIAKKISPAISTPLGIYITPNNLYAEVDTYFEGKNVVNYKDASKSEALTPDQEIYLKDQINLLLDHGILPTEDMKSLHNVMVIGPNPEDVIFIEPEFERFDSSFVKESNEISSEFSAVWNSYSAI